MHSFSSKRTTGSSLAVHLATLMAGAAVGGIAVYVLFGQPKGNPVIGEPESAPAADIAAEAQAETIASGVIEGIGTGNITVAVPGTGVRITLRISAKTVLSAQVPMNQSPPQAEEDWDFSRGLPPPPATEQAYERISIGSGDLRVNDLIDFAAVSTGDAAVFDASSITWLASVTGNEKGILQTSTFDRFRGGTPPPAPPERGADAPSL